MRTVDIGPEQEQQATPMTDGLGSAILLDNARWFVRVRWIVVGVFLAAGTVGALATEAIEALGLVPPVPWAWCVAFFIAIANTGFLLLVRRLDSESPQETVEASLWLQIWVDLVAVTAVVHIVGSTETFIPFCYVLHIAMACVFFSRLKSFLVVAVAAALYCSLVGLETAGVLGHSSILQDSWQYQGAAAHVPLLLAMSGVLLWGLIWYLVSTLAASVRDRDRELDRVNRLLVTADEEKNQAVLRTAHDLKAPFAGIENNIQVLRLKYWEEATDPIREIIERIEARSRSLRTRTKDILMLGNIRSHQATEPRIVSVQVDKVIDDVVAELSGRADAGEVSVAVDVLPVSVMTGARQLSILFANIISNAITYSPRGKTVRVTSEEDEESVTVSVSDEGIGIDEDALPNIFDEYYRTKEAAQFNSMSTGLGLAIVKRIALNLELGLKVTSEAGSGTTFEVTIPKGELQG